MALPESFRDLKSLQTLDLSSNQLTTLPESFSNLKSLNWLNLESNQMTTLPESFPQLSNLQTLVIKNNPLDDRGKNILDQLKENAKDMKIIA